jgi:molybdopterin-guanine dinucleotide biosynthesis protein A
VTGSRASTGTTGRRELPSLSGIVLGGGRSSRFGSDKLRAVVDGRTLLEHAVAAVAAVAAEVIVVCAPGDEWPLPDVDVPIRRAFDPEPFGGPLVGLLTGLEAAREPIVVVVGGDMPSVRPSVLEALVRAVVAAPDGTAAGTLSSQGRLVPLPAVLRTGAATDVARRLVADGERRLRAVFDRLVTRQLAEIEWRPLDPDGATLRDVDRPEDL